MSTSTDGGHSVVGDVSVSIVLVVSACGESSKLSSSSSADVGLSTANSVSGGFVSMVGKASCRSTSLNSLSVMAKRITDVVSSGDELCD